MATKKYLSLDRLAEYDALLKAKIATDDDAILARAKTDASNKDAVVLSEAQKGIDAVQLAVDTLSNNFQGVNSTISTHTGNTTVHITSGERANWDAAYSHSTSTHAPSNAEKNIIVGIQKNGTDLTVDSSTRKVNITVPTTAAEIGAATSGHNHDSAYDTKGAAANALADAKAYADTAASTVKNDLLNGAGGAYDTLKELGDLIVDNSDAIEALETIASGKANAEHTHAIADVSGLQSALDGKAASSHGTHVTYSTTAPVMDGTASVGSASTVARSDHKHPTDTSRASKTEFDTHVADTTKHITSTERTNWGTAYSHSQAAHAPSNAQVNVIESIKVNGTAQTISSKVVNITVPTKASDIGAATADHTHTIDSALSSSSTNPVQNKVVNSAIVTATNAISANTSSISSHSTAISNLQTAMNEIQEITSEEIQNLFNS